MEAITIRLDSETIEKLDEEYEERGFRNRTLYLRNGIIEQRDLIFDDEGQQIEAAERLADLEERLENHDGQLEDHDNQMDYFDERLEKIEEKARPFSWSARDS